MGHMLPLRAQLTRSSTCENSARARVSGRVCGNMYRPRGAFFGCKGSCRGDGGRRRARSSRGEGAGCHLYLCEDKLGCPGLPMAGAVLVAIPDRCTLSGNSDSAGCVLATPADRCSAFIVGLARADSAVLAGCAMAADAFRFQAMLGALISWIGGQSVRKLGMHHCCDVSTVLRTNTLAW